MSEKIRVGLDWDDVITPWYAPAHEACKRAGITNGVEPKIWDVPSEYGVTSEVWRQTIAEASHRGEIYAEPPYEEALWAMRDLYWNCGDQVDIVIATARSHFAVREPEWLQQTVIDAIEEYAIPCDELLFVADKREAKCDWFIDDSIKQYEALAAVDCRVYLRTQPWNVDHRQTNPFRMGVFRVDSVTQYVNTIKEALA